MPRDGSFILSGRILKSGGKMVDEKCEKDFSIKVISETVADEGFVDCVWEMPVWLVEKLEAEAKKRKISLS